MMVNAVEMRGVSKAYKDFALKDVDLSLPEGLVMGLIGPNGAGKSTSIRILMGLLHQDEGAVTVLGHDMPDQQAAAKADIGYVSEDLRLYGGASLQWHMDFIASVFPAWDSRYAGDLLRRFDLKAGQKIKGMSHGQRVKAALLLVFARFPKLLILDEPTTGLDPVARQEVLGALVEVLSDEERTILFSSHNTQDVEQLSDQITFIDRGKVIASSDKETFLDNWRRVRLEVPEGSTVPDIKGVRDIKQSGRLATVVTGAFREDTTRLLEATGATVRAVDHMTLEEIFIADVAANRGRANG